MARLTLTLVTNPFAPAQGRVVRELPWMSGQPLSAYLLAIEAEILRRPLPRQAVVLDGRVTSDLDAVPRPGANLCVIATPADPVGGLITAFQFFSTMAAGTGFLGATGAFLVKTAVLTAVGFGVGQMIAALTPKPRYDQPSIDDFSTSGTYSWEPGVNAVAEGAALPVLYGRRRITPPVIAQHLAADSYGNDHLHVLLGLCEGGAGAGTGGSDLVALADYVLDAAYEAVFINGNHYSHYLQDALAAADATTNKVSLASKSATTGSGTAANAFDGSTSTYWIGTRNDGKGALRLDFGTSRRIRCTSIVIKGYDAANPGTYLLSASNVASPADTDWVTLASGSGSTSPSKTLTVTDQTYYRHFQLYCTTGEAYAAVREWELYGSDSGHIYPDVAVVFREGDNTQAVIANFDDTYCTLGVGKELDTDWFTYPSSPGAGASILEIGLHFPQGLYYLNPTTGQLQDETVQVAAEYRTVSSAGATGAWTALSGSPWTIAGQSQSAYRVVKSVSGLSAYKFEVRVKFYTAPTQSLSHVNRCVWEYLQEGVTDAFTYPNVALLSLEALATKALSGSFPRVECIAERLIVLVDGVAKSARNPAWAAWDLLTHSRYGGAVDATRLLSDEFSDWADFCDNMLPCGPWAPAWNYSVGDRVCSTGATGNGYYYECTAISGSGESAGSEPTWPTTPGDTVIDNPGANQVEWTCRVNHVDCDVYFDSGITVAQALDYVSSLGRASVVQRGTSFGVVIDRAGSSVQLFSSGNIVAGTIREEYLARADLTNAVEVTFFDQDRDWQRQVCEVRDDSFDATDFVPQISQVTLFGCTDIDQAAAHGRWLLRANRYARRTISFEADVDSIACQVGDLIDVAQESLNPAARSWGGRVVSATSSSVTFDRSVTRVPGETYRVLIRHADGTRESPVVSAVGVETVGPTVNLPGSFLITPAAGDLYAFGSTAEAVRTYRVIRVTKSQDLRRQITALEYREEVYL